MPYICWNTHIASDKKHIRVYSGKNLQDFNVFKSNYNILLKMWKEIDIPTRYFILTNFAPTYSCVPLNQFHTYLPVSVMWFIHWFDIAIATQQHGNMLAKQCCSPHTIWWIAAWYIQHILMYIDLCFLLLGYCFNITILTLHLEMFGHDLHSV